MAHDEERVRAGPPDQPSVFQGNLTFCQNRAGAILFLKQTYKKIHMFYGLHGGIPDSSFAGSHSLYLTNSADIPYEKRYHNYLFAARSFPMAPGEQSVELI